MLFTRCPHCNTTFRITAEALAKADGQVRCGRCVNIFNAYEELREESDAARPESGAAKSPETAHAQTETGDDDEAPREDDAAARDEPASTAGATAARTQAAEFATGSDDAARDDGDGDGAHDSDTDGGAATAEADDAADDDDATAETDQTAETADDDDTAADPRTGTWLPEEPAPTARRSGLWAAAAALALLVLLGQVAHRFRTEVATQPGIGPLVQSAYAWLGTPVLPRWDLEQYRVLDWVATAEPGAGGQGNLAISARIRNRGPAAQPYPHVLVQLKDRWETAIGSRVFTPREYLAAPRDDALMAPGDTAQARLILVDPGPDAYGFELDVCIAEDAEHIRCATDRVFR